MARVDDASTCLQFEAVSLLKITASQLSPPHTQLPSSQALRELRRVLAPGGRVAVLDFNNSQQPIIDGLQVRHQQEGNESRKAGRPTPCTDSSSDVC